MKKLNLFSMMCLMALPLFTGCGKENESNSNDIPQPQKHNVEFVYNRSMSSIPVDTIAKYAAQPEVDTLFLIPENTHQFAGFTANQLSPYIKALRKRHAVAPNRVFGKGELFVNSLVEDNTDAYKFFADTLRYNVIRNNAKVM